MGCISKNDCSTVEKFVLLNQLQIYLDWSDEWGEVQFPFPKDDSPAFNFASASLLKLSKSNFSISHIKLNVFTYSYN